MTERTPEFGRPPTANIEQYWKDRLAERKNSQLVYNKSKIRFVRYKVGFIYGKSSIDKARGVFERGQKKVLRSWWCTFLTGGVSQFVSRGLSALGGHWGNSISFDPTRSHPTENTPGESMIVGYKANNKFVDSTWHSEYFASDQDKGGKPPVNDKIVGNYIYPYFRGRASVIDKDKSNPQFCQEDLRFEVDTHGLPHHFLYHHCYYEFEVFGEQFAKIYGIEKMGGDNIFGFNWTSYFSWYVGWHLHTYIVYGESFHHFHYTALLKEDINPSDGGLTKWAVGAVAGVALAAVSGGASVAATAAAGKTMMQKTEATNEEIGKTPFYDTDKKTGKKTPTGFTWGDIKGGKHDKESAKRLEETQEEVDETMDKAKVKAHNKMERAIGKGFSGIGRVFEGGSGTFSSSIDEFVANKLEFAMLFVRARTSMHYQNAWLMEMNRRIATHDFYFGHEGEIALREGFGMISGRGYDREKPNTPENKGSHVLSNLHGFIQLQDTVMFPGKYNPFIDFWVGTDIFVYQMKASKRPKLNKEDFFEGFQGKISFGLQRQGGVDSTTLTHKKTHYSEKSNPESSGYVFTYIWCKKMPPLGKQNGFTVSKVGSTVGSGDKVTAYPIGGSPNTTSLPSGSRGGQYYKVYFSDTPVGSTLTFGHGCEHVVLKYMKSDPKEEQVATSENPPDTYWKLVRKDKGQYGGATCDLVKVVGTTETTTERIEANTNALNLNFQVSVGGMSGLEGWGNNPPDGFGGGGISQSMNAIPPSVGQQMPGIGISLPDSNALNFDLSMPAGLGTAINPDISISQQPFEMPRQSGLENLQSEWSSGFQSGTQDAGQAGSTDRGEDTTQSRGDDDEQTRTN